MDQDSGPVGYRLAKTVLSGPLHRAYDIVVDGIARIPDGPVVLAANHRSFMDSVFLALVVDRPVSFLAKAEYFDQRRTAWILRSTGQIPLRRGSPAGARQALDAAGAVLGRGGIVGVYPEGTRSRDGRLHRGHLGPARLAARADAPIVPVGLIGTDHVQAPGQRLPRVAKGVTIRFGFPMRLDPPSGQQERPPTQPHRPPHGRYRRVERAGVRRALRGAHQRVARAGDASKARSSCSTATVSMFAARPSTTATPAWKYPAWRDGGRQRTGRRPISERVGDQGPISSSTATSTLMARPRRRPYTRR